MAVEKIHTFIVHPRKRASEISEITGAAVDLKGKIFDLLQGIYDKSEQECDVRITFTPSKEGKQQNDCRDLVCAHLAEPNLDTGRAIAARLEKFTDGRSGLGLLFLICGTEGEQKKIVLSRFPTDNAIYVEEDAQKLEVQFLERVFMKNKSSYKAVTYSGSSLTSGFWNGSAIDRQINNPIGEVSDYWIVDFLASQLAVTPAAGTRRLATALREAAKKADIVVKKELVAAATLAANLDGETLNITQFGQRFSLSDDAMTAIANELRSPKLAQELFQFDGHEFRSLITYKSVELQNGGMLTAPSSQFDDVFYREDLDGSEGIVRFTTESRIVDEKLRAKI